MRILIAKAGEQSAQEVLAEVHKRAADWQVSHCLCLATLQQLLTEQQYDVVVLDLDLMGEARLEQLSRITALAEDTSFIVVVAPGNQLLGARALSSGADYYLVKHTRWLNELLLIAKQAEATVSQRRQVRQTAELTRRIVELAPAISTDKDLPDLLEAVGQAAISISNATSCWLGLLNENGSQFQQHYTYGDQETAAEESQIRDIAWRAVHCGDLLIERFDSPEAGSCHTVAVPITIGGLGAMGALVLVTPQAQPLSQLHRDALQFLAAHTAIAIQNERLHRLAQRRAQQLEAAATQAAEEETRARTLLNAAAAVTDTEDASNVLNKIAISATAEIGFDCVCIYLADHDQATLQGALQAGNDGTVREIPERSFALKSGANLLADAALGEDPYVTYPASQVKEGSRTEADSDYPQLLVPLRTHGKLVGLMIADNRESDTQISAQQTRLLRALARMASVALERIRVDEVRELFVSSISHELRAPLASLQATNELILDEEIGPLNEQQRTYLSRIDFSCRHLRHILDDLTDWSHLQSGRIAVRKRPIDLREVISQVVETLQATAEQAEVEILANLPDQSVEVVTDQQRLEQVLINLVDNAIKFNYNGGQVEVAASRNDQEAVITVADTGPGIPSGLQDKIFEAFDRGSDETSRAVEGVGLGLAIATQITKLLGGQITLDSQPGQGSTFALHLPAGQIDK